MGPEVQVIIAAVGAVIGFLIAWAVFAARTEKKVEDAIVDAVEERERIVIEKDRLLVAHQHAIDSAESDAKQLRLEKDAERDRVVSEKDREIADVQSKMEVARAENEAAKASAVAEKEKVISALRGQLAQARTAHEIVSDARIQFSNDAKNFTRDLRAHTEKSMRESMRENNDHFLRLASENFDTARQRFEELVHPLSDSYQRLSPQLEELGKQNNTLLNETTRLATAMTDNQKTGRWGEIQLRRIVEMAGMTEYCDFSEQETLESGRPDLIVKLPEERFIPVDSKVSTTAFMDFMDDQSNTEALRRHAKAMQNHVDTLSRRNYGDGAQFCGFSIMFVPGDQLLAAAMRGEPRLVEKAMEKRVVIATPASLIALLWAVERGWKQNRLANDAKQIGEAGNELHKRLGTFIKHLTKMGKKLEGCVDDYNKAIGSYDVTVHPQGTRLAGMIGSNDIHEPPAQIPQTISESRKAG